MTIFYETYKLPSESLGQIQVKLTKTDMLRHFDFVNITNTNTVSAVFINLPLTVFVFTITTTVTAVSTNRIPLNLKGNAMGLLQ